MRYALLLLCSSRFLCVDARRVVLRTSGFVPRTSGRNLQAFLATPSNWPRIVLSSQSVEGLATGSAMEAGDSVDEIFGAPPILPLSVNWKCFRNEYPKLEMVSSTGLAGVARDCKMVFNVTEQGKEGARVELEMSYAPVNVLATLAIPILVLDNAFAIKCLLPEAILQDMSPERPIEKFRKLMGVLYGFAGLFHAFDLILGPSALFAMAGLPPFSALPLPGQLLAALWCFAGLVAFLSSTVGGIAADVGLALYGLTEVGCAEIASAAVEGNPALYVVQNAVLVQAAVLLSWIYANSRDAEQDF